LCDDSLKEPDREVVLDIWFQARIRKTNGQTYVYLPVSAKRTAGGQAKRLRSLEVN